MKYAMNEGTMEVPGMMDDKSINFFVVKEPQTGDEMSFVITRCALAPGETLEVSVSRQLSAMSRQLRGFAEQKRYEITVGDPPVGGVGIDAQHTQGGVKINQVMAVFPVDEKNMLIYALSGKRPFDQAHRQYWEQILASYRPAE